MTDTRSLMSDTLFGVVGIRDGELTGISTWFAAEGEAQAWLDGQTLGLMHDAGLEVDEDMDADERRWALADDGLDLHIVEMERGR